MGFENVSVPVGEGRKVSGVLGAPVGYDGKRAVIFAHGAGNDMHQSMLVRLSEGLTGAGCLTLRFNFLYREEGRNNPDRQDALYRTWESVCDFVQNLPGLRPAEIIAAGKSLGGRIASQLIAEERLPATRLILLGYPLHPPGNVETLRDAHLYELSLPVLFFAGTRDALCNLDLLRVVLSRMRAPWELEIIEGGDHSFHVPKSQGATEQQIHARILRRILEWIETSPV